MWAEEIYHEGEEGARSLGIEDIFLFLRVPLCALVVNILIPGSFAYPVIEGK
jgi:ABC-type sulfate transport system permease component